MANKRRMRKGQPFDRPRTPQIRLQNLLNLIEKYREAEGQNKTVKDFAKYARVSANYCSQVSTKARAMGDNFAAKLEDNLRLGHGWMDVEHGPWTPETPEHQRQFAIIGKVLTSLPESGQRDMLKLFVREGRRMAKEARKQATTRKPRRLKSPSLINSKK